MSRDIDQIRMFWQTSQINAATNPAAANFHKDLGVALDCIETLTAEVSALRSALEKIYDATPANEHIKWPHHHFYLVTARDALHGSQED